MKILTQSSWSTPTRWLILVLVLSAFIALLSFRALFLPADDAYITFRYASNIASGVGFVFNAGEFVLGTSAPLWTLFLALFAAAGISLPAIALVISVVSAAAMFGTTILRAPESRVGILTLIQIPLIFSLFFIAALIHSGMEAVFYVAIALYAFHAAARGQGVICGLCAAIVTLIRPDGALVPLLTFYYGRFRSLRCRLFSLVIPLLVGGGWYLFATYYFGSPLPHSVIAKRLVHNSSALENVLILSSVFSHDLRNFAFLLIGVFGLVGWWRAGFFRPEIIWVALYTAGLVASGVKPIFYWYYAPIWILLALGTGAVFTRALEFVMHHRGSYFWFRIGSLVTVAALFLLWTFQLRESTGSALLRDKAYRTIGEEYSSRIVPSDVILTAELGLIGAAFPYNRVYDSVGLVSPRVLAIRFSGVASRLDDEGYATPGWSEEVLKQIQPNWIISPRSWFELPTLETKEWFQKHYVLDKIYYPEQQGGIVVFRRTDVLPSL